MTKYTYYFIYNEDTNKLVDCVDGTYAAAVCKACTDYSDIPWAILPIEDEIDDEGEWF